MIGQMSYHLGRLDEAQARLEQAIAIRRAAGGDAAIDLASSLIHLAWVHRTRNDTTARGRWSARRSTCAAPRCRLTIPTSPRRYYELGWVSFSREQERLYRQALEILRDVPAAAERRIVMLQALSTNLRRQGRLAEAVTAGRQALAIALASFGRRASHHRRRHDSSRAITSPTSSRTRRCGTAVSATASIWSAAHFGDHSVRLLHGLNSLGRSAEPPRRRRSGNAASAAPWRSASRRPGPTILGSPSRCTSWPRQLARQGRLAEAEPLAREALDLTVKAVGTDPSDRRLVATAAHRGNPRPAAALRRSGSRLRVGVRAGAHERRHQRRDASRLRPDAAAPRRHRRRRDAAAAVAAMLEEAYNGTTHPNVQETKRALMKLYTRDAPAELVERYRVPPGRFIPY